MLLKRMRHPLCSNRLILAYSTPIVGARNKKNMLFHSVNELLFIYLQAQPCSTKAYRQKSAR